MLIIFLLWQTSLSTEWYNTSYGKWTVTDFTYTPFPDTSYTGSGFTDNSVFIFVPLAYQPDSAIHLIIDHHGHGAIIDPRNQDKTSYPELHRQAYQLYESRKKAVLVMPQAARDRPSSNPGKFARNGIFAAFIEEVCLFLKNEQVTGNAARLGQIHINSFSGGYLISAMDLSHSSPEFITHIKSVHLWDSLYGQQSIYYDWILGQKGFFFNTYTPEGGTRELSEQMADSLKRLNFNISAALPAASELPRIIIEPTDKSHGNVSRGEFTYARYLKKLSLPDIDITAVELLSCIPGENGIRISWGSNRNTHLAGYRLWGSRETGVWHLLADESRLPADANFYQHQPGERYTYKLQTVSTAGKVLTSPFMLAASGANPIAKDLIVHAENRRLIEQVRGFEPDHFLFQRDSTLVANTAAHMDHPFASCSNLAIQTGLISPREYENVFWLTGNEDAAAQLIDASEKKWLLEFINQGGNFFLSGNNVSVEFGSTTSSTNGHAFGENILGLSGSDSISSAQFTLNGQQIYGFKPGTIPHFAFGHAIQPMIATTSGQILAAYRKIKTATEDATVFSTSFSLKEIEPATGIGKILHIFSDIAANAPPTPEPPVQIQSLALLNGEVHLNSVSKSADLIITRYDSSRTIMHSETLAAGSPISIPPEQPFFLRIRSLGGNLAGKFSPLMAGYIRTGSNRKVLIVDGFERRTPFNNRDYIIEHATIFQNIGYSYDSASNQAVLDTLVSLSDYELVDWILGEESSNDHSFTPAEQQVIIGYVKGGGHLLVSGSEIGWDLQARAASPADSSFLHEIFGVRFIDDNAGTDRFYPVSGDMSPDTFNFGKTYPVKYPDVFYVLASGTPILRYGNDGIAGAGCRQANNGIAVIIGFPLETIQPYESRKRVFLHLLNYLEELN